MAPRAGTTEDKAPGPSVVKALANDTAATFVTLAIDEARAAYKRELDARTFPDSDRTTGLTPIEDKMLAVLQSHRDELVKATTPVPAQDGAK